jgi:hypothetical protein
MAFATLFEAVQCLLDRSVRRLEVRQEFAQIETRLELVNERLAWIYLCVAHTRIECCA